MLKKAISFFIGTTFISILFTSSSFGELKEDLCKEPGISTKNMTFVNLWYKRNGGDCTIRPRNRSMVTKPGDIVDVFSDLTCKNKSCSDAYIYEDLRPFDKDGNCRLRMLNTCKLSDM
jgi:hypothetical protein